METVSNKLKTFTIQFSSLSVPTRTHTSKPTAIVSLLRIEALLFRSDVIPCRTSTYVIWFFVFEILDFIKARANGENVPMPCSFRKY